MIVEKEISGFRFQTQVTFRMYIKGNPTPILITSDLKEFNRQKKMAKGGIIKPRNKSNS